MGQAQIALRPGQWRKCRTPSRAPLRNGAAVRRSRLKIATDAAGILGPFVLIGVRGDQQRSAWDLVQWRARWGQWRKCLTVVAILRSILLQWSAGLDPALAGIRRAISSSRSRRSRPVELRWVENASSGGHTYATPARHCHIAPT